MPIDHFVTYKGMGAFPDEFAEYALSLATTNIVLLVEYIRREDKKELLTFQAIKYLDIPF